MPERKGYVSARLAAPLRAPAGDGASGAPVHDFDVVVHATMANPGQRPGAGLIIVHGFHESPFGAALVMMTEGAVCGLAFGDGDGDGGRQAALADMMARWPLARHRRAPDLTGSVAARIFGSRDPGARRCRGPDRNPVRSAVWQERCASYGCVATYTDIARHLDGLEHALSGPPTAAIRFRMWFRATGR